MIKNERQYRITKIQAGKFEDTLARLRVAPADPRVHPKLQKAQVDALRSQLSDLLAEIEDYEALRDGKRQILPINSVDDLPRALIQARIAAGMSQEDLAQQLGLKEQQIQRYEATDYAAASLAGRAQPPHLRFPLSRNLGRLARSRPQIPRLHPPRPPPC